MTESIRVDQASAAELDWSQVRETVLMLELSAGQIDAAMHESNDAVNVLTGSFTQLAGLMQHINDTLNALPDTPGNAALKSAALGSTEQVTQIVGQSIVAFQFYDKLSQRLNHVCHSLSGLSGLVGDESRMYVPAEWQALQGAIRAKYSMVEEVAMFEAVLAGMSVQDAITQFVLERKEHADNDIELF